MLMVFCSTVSNTRVEYGQGGAARDMIVDEIGVARIFHGIFHAGLVVKVFALSPF